MKLTNFDMEVEAIRAAREKIEREDLQDIGIEPSAFMGGENFDKYSARWLTQFIQIHAESDGKIVAMGRDNFFQIQADGSSIKNALTNFSRLAKNMLSEHMDQLDSLSDKLG